MGHQHLLTLPKSRDWKGVIALIADGASAMAIASATTAAADKSMIEAADDPAVRQSFFLLTQIPQAARDDDFHGALTRLGLHVGPSPTLIDVGAAMMDAIDLYVSRLRRRTDYGEIAQLSAVESLQAIAGRELGDLFGADSIRLRKVLRGLGDGRQFAWLARDFFARLTRRHLAFYLDRELAGHVGASHRFPNLRGVTDFEEAVLLHCREASRIIKDFAEQWYGKHLSEGGIDRDKAGAFVAVATGKIRAELLRRAPANG